MISQEKWQAGTKSWTKYVANKVWQDIKGKRFSSSLAKEFQTEKLAKVGWLVGRIQTGNSEGQLALIKQKLYLVAFMLERGGERKGQKVPQ